ncbi:PepSY-associated TM helix [Pigmentiphaga humi]|uniref:PepSY-associated TM helix n=1 Tax=Pigmentiphaga humi TaxID=2478468 RepID=A0A3P4B086_9BURK|nr:PepSY-associated TM helix domain-containing protein [Pigmentiphaga humi]VCU68525.1 PepSY-associated TM helix [Pigmentiphaga humi]
MMSSRALRCWRGVHEWSSLVCTVFLLMLCLTGLPLVFHDEIDGWLEPDAPAAAARAPAAAPADMDEVIALVRQAYPERPVQFVAWLDEPGHFRVGLNRDPQQQGQKPFVLVDGTQRRIVGEAWSEKDWRNGGVMSVLLMLHTNLLMGQAAQLFLGAMGVLFVVSLVSGAVVYGPFMRRLPFGTVRQGRSRRLAWLDLHNLLGIAALLWMLVVGLTGAINTLDSMVFGAWQKSVAQRLKIEFADAEPIVRPQGLQRAVDGALAFLPHSRVNFVAFPGSMFATPRHYAVYLQGDSPLTAHLLHPVLVDPSDGALVDVGNPPWYLWALEVSRPLHFGDYGGLPLKVLWAVFDLLAIVVLGSGVYLWVARRRRNAHAQ